MKLNILCAKYEKISPNIVLDPRIYNSTRFKDAIDVYNQIVGGKKRIKMEFLFFIDGTLSFYDDADLEDSDYQWDRKREITSKRFPEILK